MADNTRLRAIGPDQADGEAVPAADDTLILGEGYPVEQAWDAADYEEESPQPRHLGWLVPAAAFLAVAGWSAFFMWANIAALAAGVTPAQGARLVIDWSVPVILVVGLWLLAMRNSRREAHRFAQAASALAHESRELETRLTAVNRELSLARDFIAAQSRDLESLGRIAAERLSHNADRLQGLIRDNGEQVETIGRVSATALANMDRLRDDLPVISNSARDVTSQIAHAGETARHHLDEMVGGFGRLNDLGNASGDKVAALQATIDQAVAAFEGHAAHLETVLAARFAALTERSGAFRAELDGREVEAFAAMRRRADTLAQEVAAGAEHLARMESEALAAVSERIAHVREDATQMAQRLRDGEVEARQRWADDIAGLEERLVEAVKRISDIDTQATDHARGRLDALRTEAIRVDDAIAQRVATFDAQCRQRESAASEREGAALQALHERLAAFDSEITERQEEHLAHVSGLAERNDGLAARLRELNARMDQLVAQGRQTDGELDQAAATFAARIAESRAVLEESGALVARLTDDSVRLLELIRSSSEHTGGSLPKAIGQAETRLSAFEDQARSLAALIAQAENQGATLAGHVSTVRTDGTAALDELATLDARMSELSSRSAALAGHAREELSGALAVLEEASRRALGEFQSGQAEAVRQIAERIAADSSAAITTALRENSGTVIAELEEAARHAGESGRETAVQLRDQLARVNELAGNLEQRVAHAREQAEQQVDNDFSRRMALITEGLNSSAIDISKAFANEVTDTAWASYLRGDRGIFTRRAVRLLDNQDARAVAEIYQGDADFRETVNRYIHDFEAMLRSILSTRDGHTLAVTLLSSDMGKLYVALAQSIDRLRT